MENILKPSTGNTYLPSAKTTETLGRPRRRSIDTPALKLDTSVVVSVTESVSATDFPPPPPKVNKSKVKSSNVQITSQQLEKKSPQLKKSQNGSCKSPTTPAFRSMFPRFDNNMNRYSQQSHAVGASAVSNYSASVYSQPRSPPAALVAGESWASNSRLSNTFYQHAQLRVEESIPAGVSTAEEVLDLWTVALGQGSSEPLPKYTLRMKCDTLRYNYEAISLRSTTTELYSLSSSAGAVSITRKHPLIPSSGVSVVTTTFQAPATTAPILVTIFPSLAGSEAFDTAKRVALGEGYSPNEITQAEEEAVETARSQQAGAVLWDSDSSRYYFAIPSLGAETTSTLPIEFVRDSHIRFLNTASQPLVTLNLVNYTVEIETQAVASLSKSVFILDILMSALLLLSVHLHRTQSMLSEPTLVAPYFAPPPKSPARKGRSSKPKPKPAPSVSSPWLSRLNPLSRTGSKLSQVTTPHSSIEQNSSSAAAFDKDIELGSRHGSTVILPYHIAPMTTPPIPENGIAPELRASNTGVDLSKFQAFDLDDPDLGHGTKMVLRLLYWFFAVLVWILGVATGILAAGVVAVGGVVGGKKGRREG